MHTIEENCQLFNSESTLQLFNRVLHQSLPTHAQVESVKASFGLKPFIWIVNSTDIESQKILETEGFLSKGYFPAMSVDLNTISTAIYNEGVEVKALDLQGTMIEEWATIVAQTFNMQQSEVEKVIHRFSECLIPGSLTLYLGYYHGKPAAAGMLLRHENVVSLHWICTLPEFQKKGLGFAVCHTLLSDAQHLNCTYAILLSSLTGKALYERLGFEEYDTHMIFAYGQQSVEHH